jgi:hypothetical protein
MLIEPPMTETAIGVARTAINDTADDGVVVIAGKRYLTPRRLAKDLKRSTRTLARWDEQRIGPPKIKIGRQVVYDEEKLPGWLAEHESKPVRRRR